MGKLGWHVARPPYVWFSESDHEDDELIAMLYRLRPDEKQALAARLSIAVRRGEEEFAFRGHVFELGRDWTGGPPVNLGDLMEALSPVAARLVVASGGLS